MLVGNNTPVESTYSQPRTTKLKLIGVYHYLGWQLTLALRAELDDKLSAYSS